MQLMTTSQQKIGFWPLTSLVTGNLVGSGVFLLPATLASFGIISLLGWIITSIGAIILALIFAELSSHCPKIGGPYAYSTEAFGKSIGFFIAWGYWILAWVSNSALLAAAVGYFSSIVPGVTKEIALALEISILIIITLFNLFGIRTTGRGELVITTTKVLPLILLPLIALFFLDFSNITSLSLEKENLLPNLNTVAFLTLWGFVGLESGTVPGEQVNNPKKNIPLATITGTLIAATIYIVGTIAVFGIVPTEILADSKAPYADVAAIIFGGSWGVPVAIAAIISCIGSLNGWTMVTGRIAQAAAKDNLFPTFFAKTNRYGTPYLSVLISSCLSIPFVILSIQENLLEQFNTIIDISVTFVLIIYLVSVLAMFKIYYKANKLTFYRICIALIGLIFTLWALWAASLKTVCLSLTVILLGIPLWLYNINYNRLIK